MSEPASGDRLTLEMFLSDDRSQIFIGDFDGGVAIFSHGLTGKRLEYVLQGAMNGGYVNLVRNQTIERTLYGLKNMHLMKGLTVVLLQGIPLYTKVKYLLSSVKEAAPENQ